MAAAITIKVVGVGMRVVVRAWELKGSKENYQMKKTMSILAIALLVAGSQLSAQSFQLGIKGGGNIESFTGSDGPNYSSHTFQAGWNAGVFTNLFLGNHFAIAPELLYTTAGSTVKTITLENNGNVYINNHLNLAYLSVPVMAKYRFTGRFTLKPVLKSTLMSAVVIIRR